MKTAKLIFVRIDNAVRRFEPWGIVLTVIALFVAIGSFWLDYQDRIAERKLRAWEFATSPGPYSGAKRDAVQYLVRHGNDLSGAQLAGVLWPVKEEVSETQFTHTLLKEANFNGKTLLRARFHHANLEEAQLFEGDFSNAVFRDTNLKNAIISDSVLQGAGFLFSDLSGVEFDGSDLTDADFLHATMDGTTFFGTELSNVNFMVRDPSGGKLMRAPLDGALFCLTNMPDGSTCNRDCTRFGEMGYTAELPSDTICPWLE